LEGLVIAINSAFGIIQPFAFQSQINPRRFDHMHEGDFRRAHIEHPQHHLQCVFRSQGTIHPQQNAQTPSGSQLAGNQNSAGSVCNHTRRNRP
jgi:hypothetical protein